MLDYLVMLRMFGTTAIAALLSLAAGACHAQAVSYTAPPLVLDQAAAANGIAIFASGKATPLLVDTTDEQPVLNAAAAFADDVRKVSGVLPQIRNDASSPGDTVIVVGTVEHSAVIHQLIRAHKLDVSTVQGRWEGALVSTVDHPLPGIRAALVIVGSDARGAAFALFDLSRAMGVSPWNWWADVPMRHRSSAFLANGAYVQQSPAVQYRGIFLNDEDWGLRPWAAKKMDPQLQNIGPATYTRIFELLLRLHANTLWPAMHPGSMPFHAVAENARLAQKWGIVMGSSHSEALLRNNVGEWDEGRDGPWNYQLNRPAMKNYWADGLKVNGAFENVYTVALRGQHDSGLEATGTPEVKARLVEQVMADQRALLKHYVNADLAKVPQVIWLYKESIDLYRVGMKVPDDVTLGWTDDNYGYIRQLPNATERQRPGGSALYYHVSYWGSPHDYLWLCSTPPALMQEELTKAWDHGVRKMWILNVGDIKPAEQDIDYFLTMAWQAPVFRDVSQQDFMTRWYGQQFSSVVAPAITSLMEEYYHLNFIRRPEFMGFNGYNDEVRRTAFNPLAWGDQNHHRTDAWNELSKAVGELEARLPQNMRDAYFELVRYLVEGAAAQNLKFLWTDRSYLDQHERKFDAVKQDSDRARDAYARVQQLTEEYNHLSGGKWEGMMSSHPRDRRVFEMPETAEALATSPVQLTLSWVNPGQLDSARIEAAEANTVALDATHYTSLKDSQKARWQTMPGLGLGIGSMSIRDAGQAQAAQWVHLQGSVSEAEWKATPYLEYSFATAYSGARTLSLFLLPTFPLDSSSGLHYAVSIDGSMPTILDATGAEEHKANLTPWDSNVLRGAMIETVNIDSLAAGKHTLKFYYGEPGIVLEYLTISPPDAPPAYPFPSEITTEHH